MSEASYQSNHRQSGIKQARCNSPNNVQNEACEAEPERRTELRAFDQGAQDGECVWVHEFAACRHEGGDVDDETAQGKEAGKEGKDGQEDMLLLSLHRHERGDHGKEGEAAGDGMQDERFGQVAIKKGVGDARVLRRLPAPFRRWAIEFLRLVQVGTGGNDESCPAIARSPHAQFDECVIAEIETGKR